MRSKWDYTDEDGRPLGEWELITCEQRDELISVPSQDQPGRWEYRDTLTVFAGWVIVNEGERYTEWGEKGSQVPLVYDYIREGYGDGPGCEHARFVTDTDRDHEPCEPTDVYTLSVILGETPDPNGEELGQSALESVSLGGEVQTWLSYCGCDDPGDDLTWVLVTPSGEHPGRLTNVVDQRDVTVVDGVVRMTA